MFRLIGVIVAGILGLFLTSEVVGASAYSKLQSNQTARQVLVIFVDGLSFADMEVLRTYPHVDKWLSKGKFGAVTIRPAGARTDSNAYVLTGSGGQAVYSESSGTAYHPEEQIDQGMSAAEWIKQMDVSAVTEQQHDAILFPGIYRLQYENQEKPFIANIGLLGSTLREHGMVVSLYGNADLPGKRQRPAALFAMDQNGRIPQGDISGNTNQRNPSYPYGMQTNYSYLVKQLLSQQQPGMHVVELADLARLYSLQNHMSPNSFNTRYGQILGEIDRFVGTVLNDRRANQMVMLFSVNGNGAAQKQKSLLTPILVWDSEEKSCALHSLTTRQAGIINGIDIAPTILQRLGVPAPAEMIGQPIASSTVGELHTFDQFLHEVARIDHIYQNRSSIMYIYVMLQIVTLILASLLWIWHRKDRSQATVDYRRAIRLWLLSMLFFPALFLIEPIMLWSVPPVVVLGAIVLLAFGSALIVERFPFPKLLFCVASFTAMCILIDGFTGAKAMSRSYMGYDPVIGARFYGLGNEYEGVLIGATVLLVSSLYEGWRRSRQAICFALAGGIFAVVLFYMAYPALGTNAGGFLAGTIGFAIALFRLQGWRLGKRGLLVVGGGLCAGVLLLIGLHIFTEQPVTHVGRIAQEIVSGNWQEVRLTVERKLAMNWRLIRISAWSKVFIVSLFTISLLSLRPTQFLRRLSQQYPLLARGFTGIVAGSLATLVLNDSGIVSAATSIIFFVIPVLYAALTDEKEGELAS